jgi:hypothetical protein
MFRVKSKMVATALVLALALGLWVALVGSEGERIEGGRKGEARVVRVDGVEFEGVADRKWRIPVPGKAKTLKLPNGSTAINPAASEAVNVKLGLRLTNRNSKDLLFQDFHHVPLTLTSANGQEVPCSFGRDRTRLAPPIRVKGGQSATLSLPAHLQWRQNQPDTEPVLCLIGDLRDGSFWAFKELCPGKYTVRLTYESHEQEPEGWSGKVTTNAGQVELVPPSRK